MKPTTAPKPRALNALYNSDETGWLERMAQLIQDGQFEQLDYENLAEYLHDRAERDKSEVRSRLQQLIVHLLKWEHQSKKRTRSWQNTILKQREKLEDRLYAKTLANYAREVLANVYPKAVKRAARETGLDAAVVPVTCPYSLDYLLGEDFPS